MQSAGRAAAAGLLPHGSSCLGALCPTVGQTCGLAFRTGSVLQNACMWVQQHHAGDIPVQHSNQQQQGYSNESAASAPSSNHLGDILKLDLLNDKTADEVEHIWLTHHESSSGHVATVMSREEHAILTARVAASPLFVLPIRKPPKGFCTLFVQWQPQQALITTLDEYKKLGANAPPHFTMTLYRECISTHGLVLVRGDVLNPGLVSPAEGRTVMELIRAFYTDPQAHQLVYAFNHQPDKFNFRQLLTELGLNKGGTA